MKRGVLSVIAGLLAALAIGYALRTSQKTSNAAVTALLPAETVIFVHVPDFNRTREEWHRSDIYQLYLEPAVQNFLRKPLTRVPVTSLFSQKIQEIERLEIRDGFLAVTSIANENPTLVAGFRFRGSEAEAEKTIGGWRSQLQSKNGISATNETIDYQQHKIDISKAGPASLATAYDGPWFFASTDTDELKATLDRADGRNKDGRPLLSGEATFREGMAQMPASYATCFYLRPKALVEKLAALRSTSGQPVTTDQRSLMDQIRCVCAATRFDNGKLHDVVFVGMPKQIPDADLTRNSIGLATKNTFTYFATLVDISKQFALVDPSAGASYLGARLQKIGRGLAAAGMTAAEWKAIFGSELGLLADWSTDSHWPSALVISAVKDAPRAKKMAGVLARVLDDDGAWVETDKDGVHYISTPYAAGLLTFRPTIGVSDRFMVAGLDSASVEAAMRRSASGASELLNSESYTKASRAVPPPSNAFAYVDPALLYTRLDATLRPMLLMSAAFMPSIGDYADLNKLPGPEVVTRHLSPIVWSQRYNGNGYLAESVGPITMSQCGVVTILAGAFGAWGYQHSGLSGLSGLGVPSSLTAPAAASPSPSGTP